MIYKVPCPDRTNGVRLFKEGDQISIEYTRGEPQLGKMALDSALGKPTRTLSFRPRMAQDDLPKGTGIARSEGEMKPRGSTTINDEDPDDGDSGSEIVNKLMTFLADRLSPDELDAVAAILGDADAPDSEAGEPRQASDRRRVARLAADAARQRPPTVAERAEFDLLFPDAKRILVR